MRSFFFIIVCTLFISINANAQPPIFCKHFTTGNGLMYGNILALAQDSSRFIWIAGDEGLQRFDGHTFENYYHTPQTNIPRGRLVNLYVDKNNKLWIGSFNDGFGFINLLSNQSYTYNKQSQKKFTAEMIGFREFWQHHNTIYASSTAGLVIVEKDSINKIINTANSSLQGNLIGHIVADKQHNIWLGTIGGLNLLKKNDAVIYNHTNNKTIQAFASNVLQNNVGNKAAIAKLYIDKNNNLWISTWQPALYKYSINTNTLTKITLPNSTQDPYASLTTAFVEDDYNNLWIATANNGLYKLQYNSNQFYHYLHNNNNNYSIATNAITALLKDSDGYIWVAGKGVISVFNTKEPHIKNFTSTTHGYIRAAIKDKENNIWAADDSFLYKYNHQYAITEKINYKKNVQSSTKNKTVWCIKLANNGSKIYIGLENGLIIYDKQSKRITDFTTIKELQTNPITDIIELSDGNLILCRWWWSSNLIHFNPTTLQIIPLTIPKEIIGATQFEIACAIQQNNNNYYLCSKKGLLTLNTKNLKVQVVDTNFVVGKTITYNDSILIGATAYDGLKTYHIKTGKTTLYSKQEGLNVYNTKSIIYTGNNNFYISSPVGLFYWNIATKSSKRYAYESGLDNINIEPASLLLHNNNLIFSNGSLHYLSLQDTAAIPQPNIAIINCVVGKKNFAPINLANSLVINYNENNLQVKFGIINSKDENTIYQYRLIGYDKDWQNGSSQFINYTGLPSGNYILQARASQFNKPFSAPQQLLQFRVNNIFYKTWWFYLILILMLLTAAFYFYKLKINRLLELQKLRNNISRDLHDEVGSTLSSVSILSTSVLNNLDKEPIKAKEWITQIGNNAQTMLNTMDEIVWTINPKQDSLEIIISKIKEFAYHATEAADILLQFNETGKMANITLPMPVKRNIYLLTKEAVNNAIKHAACKTITINIHHATKKIALSVTDDGKGFDMNKNTNRNGIKNMQQRAKEINATLTINSNANGTKINVEVAV